MSTGGRALPPPAAGTAKGIPYPRISPHPVVFTEKRHQHAQARTLSPANPPVKPLPHRLPTDQTPTPLISSDQAPTPHPGAYPHPRTPARTRKTPPPRPASRARPPPPPPWFRTRLVSTRQGRVRKMIPVSVCGACRPEVLAALPLVQHRCDIVNTLVGGSGGFFCHSVVLERARIGSRRCPGASNRRVVCPVSRRQGYRARRRNTAKPNAAPEGNPMSMGGRTLHPPPKTAKASAVRASSYPRSS